MCINYQYGSRPNENGYNYRDFVKHLAPRLPVNDKVFYWQDSLEWRDNHTCIPYKLFRAICHWKSPRRQTIVNENNCQDVNDAWSQALDCLTLQGNNNRANAIRFALQKLVWNAEHQTGLKGVQVRTASALLTAWNPDEFGIIDFKVLKVLQMPESYSVKSYLAFRKTLQEIRERDQTLQYCAFRQIELALWHYYAIQESGVREFL